MNVLNLMRLRVRWSLLLRVALMVSAVGLFAEQAAGQTAAAPRVLVMPFSAEVADGAPGGAGGALWLGEAAAVLLAESLPVAGLPAMRSRRTRSGVRSSATARVPGADPSHDAACGRADRRVGHRLWRGHAGQPVDGACAHPQRPGRPGAGRGARSVEPGRHLHPVRSRGRQAGRLGRASSAVGPAPARPPALPLEAFENYVKGLVAAAPTAQQRFLEAANTQVPEDPRILTAMWRVYTSLGMHDKALATANAVPASSPLGRKARFEVALSLIELRRLDGAFKELTALHTAAPSPAIANAIGVVQLYRGTAEGGTAAVWFARANDLAPGNTDYLFNLGYAHALAQNAPAALQWLREAVRHDAANGDAHLVMSEVLASTGRTTEAQRERDLARLLGTGLEVVPSALSTRITPGLARLEDDLVARRTHARRGRVAGPDRPARDRAVSP